MTDDQISGHGDNGIAVVELAGELDISDADRLRTAIGDAARETPRLVLDLTDVEFMDSMVLGVLVAADKRSRSIGGWVRLAAPQPNVRRVLQITGLDQVLGIFATAGDAMAHNE